MKPRDGRPWVFAFLVRSADMPKRIKYVADVKHVHEVSLRGSADFDYWSQRLAGEGLTALAIDGRAQFLLIAAEMKFNGVRFSELSFSILVAPGAGESGDCCYLMRAYNSCRLFAFSERVLFSTPYYYGDVRVTTTLPASLDLAIDDTIAFKVAMEPCATRTPSRVDSDGWDGPVYLPCKRRGRDDSRKMFIAKVSGQAQTYSFQPGQDTLEINPDVTQSREDRDMLQQLNESEFTPTEWVIRNDARHAKSKTYAVPSPATS